MPARKSPPDWKPRMVALLRKASEVGGVRRAAGAIGEKREPLIEDAIRMAEAINVEMLEAAPGTWDPRRYNKACGRAADRLEAK